MKVLMLSNRFYPHIGGVEKHIMETCTVLLERGYEITIITDKYSPDLAKEEVIELSGNHIMVIRLSKFRWLNLPIIRELLFTKLLLKYSVVRNADIVHCHDFATLLYWYLPFKLLFPKKAVYLTFHGWEGDYPPRKFVIRLRKLAEHLVCGNICAGDFICKWYGTKADYVTYGGVNLNALDDHENGAGAVFVGRLADDTGINVYLQTIRLLKNRGVTLPLVVCGDGPLKESCKKFVEDHKLDVTFHGFIQNTSKVVMPSRYVFVSGYLAILEAMSMKKIVFSVYDNPLKKDYLRLIPNSDKTMFIVDGPEELANQIEMCAKDEVIAGEIRASAHEWAIKQSWQVVADIYQNLWAKKCN